MKDPFQQSFKRYDVEEPSDSGSDWFVGLLISLVMVIVGIVGFVLEVLK
jgi:hypothetical protein